MLEFILSIFYPKRCVNCKAFGKYICDNCFTQINYLDFSKCIECMRPSVSSLVHPKCKKRYSMNGVFTAVEYKSVIKKAVYSYKYAPYIYNLKDVLSRLMYESLIQNEVFQKELSMSDNVWITCVPLHKKRLNHRGYNHSKLIAQNLAQNLGLRFNSKILIRIRDTKPQFELKKEQRIKNIKGAFEVSKNYKEKMRGKTIFIVDDVFTTGATLRECGKLLKKSGVKGVYGLVLSMES